MTGRGTAEPARSPGLDGAGPARTVRLAVEGDPELWRPVLQEHIRELSRQPTRLILDVRHSYEIDGRALGAIVLAAKVLERHGGGLELASDRPDLRRLLHATGLERAIGVASSRSTARAAGVVELVRS